MFGDGVQFNQQLQVNFNICIVLVLGGKCLVKEFNHLEAEIFIQKYQKYF